MNPYKPSPVCPPAEPREDSSQDSSNDPLKDVKSFKLVATWWFLPILFAGTFTLPVLVLGFGDPTVNPLDYGAILLQAAGNCIVGTLAGLVLVVYIHIRLRMSDKAASKAIVGKAPSSLDSK